MTKAVCVPAQIIITKTPLFITVQTQPRYPMVDRLLLQVCFSNQHHEEKRNKELWKVRALKQFFNKYDSLIA